MGIQLTDEQQYIVNEAVKFYNNSSEQVFQFAGYAGTGKSVVLNSILERLDIPLHRVAPMSYIGQASVVMRLKGLTNAKTIHSWLFKPVEAVKLDKDGNIVKDEYFNRPKFELKFEPKPLDDIDIILIDEAGSVPFELKHEIESRGKKIIATGDLGQLPPVYGNPAYLYNGKVHQLTKIMRQAENSGLLFLADRARKGLPIHEGFYGDVLVINEDDLTDQMIASSDVVIVGKNATRDYINHKVRRDILNIKTDLPAYGERMVCRKNNWNIDVDGINLANGLLGNVVNVPGVHGFDGKTYKIDFQPTFMNTYFKDISCDYNYLISNHKQKQLLKNSKYNQGEKFEFAYAITCHMSQGAQFNNGIYLEEFLGKDIQNNLNYTGITRFSNSMIYVKKKRKFY